MAWDRVRGNNGARTAGVDWQSVYDVEAVAAEAFVDRLRTEVRDRSLRPPPTSGQRCPGRYPGLWVNEVDPDHAARVILTGTSGKLIQPGHRIEGTSPATS